MVMTKEEFKQRWESGDDGGGITLGEVAEVAIAWGICSKPLIQPMLVVLEAVLAAAGCEEDDSD